MIEKVILYELYPDPKEQHRGPQQIAILKNPQPFSVLFTTKIEKRLAL